MRMYILESYEDEGEEDALATTFRVADVFLGSKPAGIAFPWRGDANGLSFELFK